MPVQITIENLRHIRRLQFSLPGAGVWLLTGANGMGKTSLLACLRRIGYSNAFPTHFPASQKSERLDSFDGSSVHYDVNGAAVTYRYRGERWVPHPKANSKLLEAGFPSVRYIAADQKSMNACTAAGGRRHEGRMIWSGNFSPGQSGIAKPVHRFVRVEQRLRQELGKFQLQRCKCQSLYLGLSALYKSQLVSQHFDVCLGWRRVNT